MDALIADFVRETTSTTGNVEDVTLAAETGYARFSDAYAENDSTYYIIRNGDNAELGIGTVKAGNVLGRTTPLVTLVGGVYDDNSPARISLSGDSVVAVGPSAKALLDAANSYRPVIDESTTARTLVLSDAGGYILCSNASGCAITVPPQSSVDWPKNCEIHGRGSVGSVTFAQGAGVTIDVPTDLSLEANAKTAWTLKRESENNWVLIGNLVAA